MKDLTHYFQLPSKEEEGENSFLVLDLESCNSKSVKKLKKNSKPFLAPSEKNYTKSKSSKNLDSPSSSFVTGPRKKNKSKLKKQNIEDNVATEDVDCEKEIHLSDIEIGLQEIKIPIKKKKNHPKQKFCKISPKLKKKRKKLSLVANDMYVDSKTSQSGLGKIKTTAGSSSHSPADVHLRKISPSKNVFEIPSDESKDCETIAASYSLQSSLVKCRSGEFISSELTSQTKYDSSGLESSQKQSSPVQPNNPRTQPRTNAFEKLMSVQVHCAQSENSDGSYTDLENIPKIETCGRANEEQHNVLEKTHRTRRQHNLEKKSGKKSTKRKRLNKDVPNELVERMAKKIKRLINLNYDSDVDVNEVVDTDNDIESKEKKHLDINTPLENLTADHFVPLHGGKAKYKCKQKKKFTPEKTVPTKENSENSQEEIKKKPKHKPPVSELVLEDPVTVQLQKALKRVEKAEKSIQKYMEMRNSCTTTNSQNKTVSQELTENIKSPRIGLQDPRASTEVLNETSNNICPVITDGIKSPCKENLLENPRPTIEFQKDKSSKGNSHKKESRRIKGSPDKKALLKVTRILDGEMEPHIYYSSLKGSANVEIVDKVKRNKRSHKRKLKTDLEVNDSSQSTEARYDTKLSDSCDEIKCKNGLFNYFNKVSKEEVLSKPQKIQVEALVHTPPTTPTKKLKKKKTLEPVCPTQKKFKRRSSNRLALSDEISLLCSEVIQLEQNSNDFDFSVNYKVRTPTKLNDVQLTFDREIKRTTENKILSEVDGGCKVFQSTSNLKLKTPSKSCENIDKSNEGSRKIPLSNTWKLRVHLGNQEKNALDYGSESDEPDPSDDSDSIFTIKTKQKNTKKPMTSKLKEDYSERSKPHKMLLISSDDSDVIFSPSSRRKNNKSSVKKMVIRNGKMRFLLKNKDTDAVRTDSSVETLSSDDSSGMETRISRKKTKESYLQKTVITGRKTRVSLRIIESNAKTPPIDLEKEEIISQSKASRLAPVFLRGNSRFKPKVDPLIVEARRNFLMSGVPDAVKKMVDIQRIFDEQEHTIFPEVSHVQQKDSDSYIWNLPDESTSVVTHSQDLNIEQTFWGEDQTLVPGVFTESTASPTSYERLAPPPPITAFRRILRELKLEFPNFPVYRAFRALRDKFLEHEEGCVPGEGNKKGRGRSKGLQPEEKVAINSQVLWTEKYRPTCVNDVFSNLGSVRQLKSWLETWKNHCEEAGKRDHQACDSSSEDEFINDGDEGSHSNGPDNTAILLGPYGSGKTAAVYAVASELGCKVLEMNASSKRTGKRVLSELLEATQSHRVGKGADTTDRNVAGFFRNGSTPKVKQKKMEREKKKAKEEKCSKMSIILVEATDIFFDDQDEGFVSALSSLVAASKRPVIFTTSEANCPHLLKFMCQHLLLRFSPASPTVMSVWLQLVCLLEGIRLSNSAIKALLHWNNGDIRRTILDLQFWVRSNGSTPPRVFKKPTTADIKTAHPLTDEDDNSNLVWGSEKDKEEKDSVAIPVYHNCADFLRFNNEIPYPLNLSSLWWNLGSLLGLPDVYKYRFNKLAFLSKSVSTEPNNFFSECCTTEDNEEQTLEVDAAEDQPCESAESVSVVDTTSSVSTTNSPTSQRAHSYNLEQMDSLALLTDTLSEVDVVSSCHRLDTYKTNPELCPASWEQPMKDSLSLRADGRLCCIAEQRVSSMWSHYVSKESLSLCSQQLSQSREAGRCVFNQCVPSHQELSWRSCQHEADRAALAAVSGWCRLDHAAVALDYNPVLRAIGRLEKSRMAGNSKRRNRFFHYLKGLGVDTTESTLHTLCSAFQEGSS